MTQCSALKLAVVVGCAVLVGLMVPTAWRPASLLATSGPGCAGSAGTNCCCSHLVDVELFGESLCPDTTHAVHAVLAPLFSNGISSLLRLRYHAYGKATKGPGGLQCQHGPVECRGNRYLNCAQKLYSHNQSAWFAYALCVQGKPEAELEEAASSVCAEAQGWDQEDLIDCAEGDLGDELEKEAGKATAALEPKLTWVPWVLVNGFSINFDLENLGRYVCAAYTGSLPRPAACLEQPPAQLELGTA